MGAIFWKFRLPLLKKSKILMQILSRKEFQSFPQQTVLNLTYRTSFSRRFKENKTRLSQWLGKSATLWEKGLFLGFSAIWHFSGKKKSPFLKNGFFDVQFIYGCVNLIKVLTIVSLRIFKGLCSFWNLERVTDLAVPGLIYIALESLIECPSL